jgi:hypothetical protein
MNTSYTLIESVLSHKGEFTNAAEAVAYAENVIGEFHQVAVVSTSKEVINAVQAAWKKHQNDYDVQAVGHGVEDGIKFHYVVNSHEDDTEEVDDLLRGMLKEAARWVKSSGLPPQSEKPAVAPQKVSLPAQSAVKTPQIATFPKGVTVTKNSQTAPVMKLYVSLFDRGGKQASTGHRIVTAVVSDPYLAGKNEDGSDKVAYTTVLSASMILPESVAKTLQWKEFKTQNGDKGLTCRAAFYGTMAKDNRPPQPGQRFQKTVFWLNPCLRKRVGVKEDGSPKWEDCSPDDPEAQLMVFPLERREQPAPVVKAAPVAKAASIVTPAAKVASVTKKVAKTAKVAASSQIEF